MFFLFQLLESIKFIKRIQTNKNYSLLLFIKNFLFFFQPEDFRKNFWFFSTKLLFFFFKRFLLENFGYSVDLIDITGLALTNILGISSILNIARSDILLLILFIASIKGYVSFTSFSYRVTKGNKIIIVIFG
jgi:hypothetical protein